MRNWRFAVVAGVVSLCASVRADVIHPGTDAWVQAARTGRADMLILGDSTVLHQGNGWDTGFNLALQRTVGIAGSGLQQGVGGEGEQFDIAPFYGTALDTSTAAMVPAGYQGYVWRNTVAAAGPTSAGTLLATILPTAPQNAAGYDWTLYTASGAGGGSVAGLLRIGAAPYTVLQNIPAAPLAAPTSGLAATTLHLNQAGDPAVAKEAQVTSLTNASIFYSRVTATGATGATVTSWNLGGKSTKDFLNDQYLHGSLDITGRRVFLNSLVDGGSGKLNVVLAEGFNDRNQVSTLSVDGVNTNSSPAGFTANTLALISNIRSDWAAGGHASDDLSFTLLGMYQDFFSQNDPTNFVQAYGREDAKIAAADPQVSYVDVWAKAPDYNTATSLGYMYDGVHFSRDGAIAYSQSVMSALVPEPTSLGVMLLAGAGLMARTRRK